MPNIVTVIIGLAVVVLLIIMTSIAKMFRKAGPNEAIIVYGFRGPRIIKGSGAVIFPMVESCRQLSLELMSFDVAPQSSASSRLSRS
jgi:flotillin